MFFCNSPFLPKANNWLTASYSPVALLFQAACLNLLEESSFFQTGRLQKRSIKGAMAVTLCKSRLLFRLASSSCFSTHWNFSKSQLPLYFEQNFHHSQSCICLWLHGGRSLMGAHSCDDYWGTVWGRKRLEMVFLAQRGCWWQVLRDTLLLGGVLWGRRQDKLRWDFKKWEKKEKD